MSPLSKSQKTQAGESQLKDELHSGPNDKETQFRYGQKTKASELIANKPERREEARGDFRMA